MVYSIELHIIKNTLLRSKDMCSWVNIIKLYKNANSKCNLFIKLKKMTVNKKMLTVVFSTYQKQDYIDNSYNYPIDFEHNPKPLQNAGNGQFLVLLERSKV